MISNSLEETKIIAKKFAAQLQGGDIVILSGELGAGKTAFTKGLAEYFGIEKEITSPTFTLMNVYDRDPNFHLDDNVKKIIHIDTYRLKNAQELIDIGALDYIGAPGTITTIEWPEKISELLANKKTIAVTIEHISENERKIIIK